METCLVIGAGGFIGKNLCPLLVKTFKVIAFDRYECEELRKFSSIMQLVGDFTNITDFTSLLKGVSVVYHLLGTALPKEGIDHITNEAQENVIPTLRLLENMVQYKVDRIIFASSGGTIYGERGNEKCYVSDRLYPQCAYAVHKQVIENYLDYFNRCTSLRCISARLANPYGMGQSLERRQGIIPIFVYRLLHGLPITVLGDGSNRRDYIAMTDMIQALVALAYYDGEVSVFNIGSGNSHSLNELIELIQNISQCQFVNINYAPKRTFDVSDVVLDIEETKRELSWNPKTSLQEGIRCIVEGYISLK